MIIVQLIGGLGNQMFQYACGKTLALKNKTSLKLDTTDLLDRSHHNFTHRNYELNVFNINEKIASNHDIKKFELKKSLPTRILSKLFIKFKYKKISEQILFNYDNTLTSEKSNLYLSGYWQNEKYFAEFESEIRKCFTFKELPTVDNEKILQQIEACNSVSIHIRRGDYVSLKSANAFHGICSLDYYYAAIALISSKISNPLFFIFSDEPEWIKQNFIINSPFLVISHNSGEKSFEDMRLMSACKHNIIANSSFSWWGAWLNKNQNKIVIAPTKWFADDSIDTKDLIPEKWIRM